MSVCLIRNSVSMTPDVSEEEMMRHLRQVTCQQRRVDLPYVPHIGIATNKDPHHLKRLANELNAAKRDIAGRINEICLCEYDGKTVTVLHAFRLGGS